jgi:hypothetical protein
MALAAKRGAAFGTCGQVNAAMVKAFAAAQAAARTGNAAAFNAARNQIQSLFAVTAVQVRFGRLRTLLVAAFSPAASQADGDLARQGRRLTAAASVRDLGWGPVLASRPAPTPCSQTAAAAAPAPQATIEYAEQTEAARKAGEPTAELQVRLKEKPFQEPFGI